jgi:imidazolonepropionase-like amidohydrolase
LRANVPIPAGSDKINGSGKFLTPGVIDLYSTSKGDPWIYSGVTTTRLFPAGREFTGETTDPETARRKVADLAAQQADFLFVRADDARLNPAVADVILEEARKFKIPVTARITTLAQAQQS